MQIEHLCGAGLDKPSYKAFHTALRVKESTKAAGRYPAAANPPHPTTSAARIWGSADAAQECTVPRWPVCAGRTRYCIRKYT
jgi:hypothetical protein